jgi:hypothetical protein
MDEHGSSLCSVAVEKSARSLWSMQLPKYNHSSNK